MSEEEKKAKIVLSMMTFDINAGCKECPYKDMDIEEHNCIGCREDACEIVLNIVNRQQKEIEDLKDIQQEMCEKEIINQRYIKENYIHKDKIREAIKNREIELYADNPENNFIPFDKVIDTLKELLEEK